MTPEEMFRDMSVNVIRDLQRWREFQKSHIAGRTRDEIARNLSLEADNTIDLIVAAGLVPAEKAQSLNRLARSIRQSSLVASFGQRAVDPLLSDAKFVDAAERLALSPSEIDENDLAYITERLLREDTLISGAILIAATDPQVRAALAVPDDVTPEQFMIDLRKSIRDSKSLQEVASPELLNLAVASIVTVVAAYVVALIDVVAVSHVAISNTAAVTIVAWALIAVKVSIAAEGIPGTHAVMDAQRTVPAAGASVVINRTDHFVWIAIPFPHCVKRFAIPPGRSSAEFGFAKVLGVLFGGRGNSVQSYVSSTGKRCSGGAYMLTNCHDGQSEIEIIDSGEGGVSVIGNSVQRIGEASDNGGYRNRVDVESGKTFEMESLAALLPATFSYAKSRQLQLQMENFHSAIKTESLARVLINAIREKGGIFN